ncbi:MAG: glycosyl transferase family 1, partial [Chloroflexota bacterium]
VMQHAFYAVPDRRHGYSVDDQARALIACLAHARSTGQSHAPPDAYTYLAYLRHATNPDGSVHNFLSFDGRRLDERGSEDAQGRTLWALGYAVRYGLDDGLIVAARELFDAVLQFTYTLRAPRAWSFVLFGLYHRLQVSAEPVLFELVHDLAQCLLVHLETASTPDWHWFEPLLTYCNAKLPAALLLAHELTGESRYREGGLDALSWLSTVVFNDQGDLRLVGQNGWYPRGGQKAAFDEQCVDAQGTVEAALLAHRLTGDKVWGDRALAAFAWFHGRNVHGLSLIDPDTWGCADGIRASGLNRNMGAESIICYVLAYLDLAAAGLISVNGEQPADG